MLLVFVCSLVGCVACCFWFGNALKKDHDGAQFASVVLVVLCFLAAIISGISILSKMQ